MYAIDIQHPYVFHKENIEENESFVRLEKLISVYTLKKKKLCLKGSAAKHQFKKGIIKSEKDFIVQKEFILVN